MWEVNFNTVGYMPNNISMTYESFEEAKEALIDMLKDVDNNWDWKFKEEDVATAIKYIEGAKIVDFNGVRIDDINFDVING